MTLPDKAQVAATAARTRARVKNRASREWEIPRAVTILNRGLCANVVINAAS
ncbi:MAG: hypothetical protein NVSMB6_11150 [Burkholderiaceae bacterium]